MGGLFGGSKSKSSTSSTVTSQSGGFSEIAGNAVQLQGGGQVNVLDQGAIEKAFSFAEQVTAVNSGVTQQALTAVGESRKAESENISGKAITYGSYAAIAVAVAWAIRGFAK